MQGQRDSIYPLFNSNRINTLMKYPQPFRGEKNEKTDVSSTSTTPKAIKSLSLPYNQ